ncbi:MAG: sugar phosphate isomerase/epimerase [Candidatus Omnitrophota bacterium]
MNKNGKITRRDFTKQSMAAAAFLTANQVSRAEEKTYPIRLGGPVMEKYESPEQWVAIVKRLGYSAAYCPVNNKQSDDVVNAYAAAAEKAGIVISEVGVWNNPMDPDEAKRRQALEYCREQLALAERIGARCCVNICGSRGKVWDGPDKDNFTKETFDMIVETTRSVIDAVKPKRTFYTLETMPWAYPDSPDSYLDLIKAIDRQAFAAHLDPVNLICSPQRYFGNGALIRECFAKLGPYIRSCHGKDIILQEKLTTHLDEIRPGLGGLDYGVYLRELSRLSGVPLMLEHLSTAEEYAQASEYVRATGAKIGVQFA